jgi:hypothetical protein
MKKIILYLKQIFVKGKTNGSPENKTTDEGDFVQLVWMIEKLRHPENKCTMNELIEEVNKNFDGLEAITKKI